MFARQFGFNLASDYSFELQTTMEQQKSKKKHMNNEQLTNGYIVQCNLNGDGRLNKSLYVYMHKFRIICPN